MPCALPLYTCPVTSTDTVMTRSPLTLDDVPALTALMNRIDVADELGEPAEEPSIREWLTMPGLDLSQDTLALWTGEELIGFTAVDVHTSLDRDGRVRCQLMGGVDPAQRRQGLGAELFDWAEERATQLAAAPTSASGVTADARTSESPTATRSTRSIPSAARSRNTCTGGQVGTPDLLIGTTPSGAR